MQPVKIDYDLVEDRVKKLNQSKGGIDIPSLIKITNSGVTVPDNVKNVSVFSQNMSPTRTSLLN